MSQLVDHQIQQQQEKSLAEVMDAYSAANLQHDCREPGDCRHGMIYPYEDSQLQSASYDLRLGPELRTEYDIAYDISGPRFQERGWGMPPGQFLLGHTEEYIRMPKHLCGRVEGKSTIGRSGLAVHVTAGFIDPGFHGQITLELVNHKQAKPFVLRPGMLIAQITFHSLAHTPRRLYGDPALGSHYQGQLGATPPAK